MARIRVQTSFYKVVPSSQQSLSDCKHYLCSVSTTSSSWTILGCRIICIIFASRRMFLATYLSWWACFLSIIFTATYGDGEKELTTATTKTTCPCSVSNRLNKRKRTKENEQKLKDRPRQSGLVERAREKWKWSGPRARQSNTCWEWILS